MSDACKRFFDISELFVLLLAFLEQKDVASLARTNREMHSLCTPSLYNELRCVKGQAGGSREFRIFESLAALHALARSIQHVRMLDIGPTELAYYYNCVLAFEKEEPHSQTTDVPVLTRPAWLPPADVHSCQMVSLPSMTRLSHFNMTTGSIGKKSYSVPSVKDLRARLPQTCWLISQNPGLTSLTLSGVPFREWHGRILAETLVGLSKLETLTLNIHCRHHYWLEIWQQLFFCLPLSIRKFSINFTENGRAWRFDSVAAAGISRGNWYLKDVTSEIARREEPLIHLQELSFHGMRGSYWENTVDIAAMLAHCPNIKKFDTYLEIWNHSLDDEAVGQLIAEMCPKIESLVYGLNKRQKQNLLPFKIMEALPAQQVVNVEFRVGSFRIDMSVMNWAIRRHSTTLRELRFQKDNDVFTIISASTVLEECCQLEVLQMPCTHTGGFYGTLYDVLAHPWACTKLKQLTLAISDCELPVEPEVLRFYLRPTPITLTEIETEHLFQLENLYRRIGSLKELQELDLRMVPLKQGGKVDVEMMEDNRLSFPAMLNLQHLRMGMPGYLDLLSGLSKLEVLQGSIRADSEETRRTIEISETNWVHRHWPSLRHAGFFAKREDISMPFMELESRYRLDGVSIQLFC
ncbi:hypothetical protein BG015_008375 [Linnemannia schmuckeri]|uniref:F-box domain-containing protein n=1 Tax=Linnemannia schmuckeri TaxID=64567 RepID=A0A9P5S0H0_9FUNG|nr:hypothetical protein BG015_008375 [Linnemannia schmuckeri]